MIAIDPPSGGGRALFEEHYELIHKTIYGVARRKRLDAESIEEFSGFAFVKILDDDAAVVRNFQGRSTLKTYLVTVVQRLYLDFQIHRYGKWRPSRRALRLGPLAIELDRLLHRDGKTLFEAADWLRERGFGEHSRETLATLARSIPNQRRRPRLEQLERAEEVACDGGVEERLLARDRRRAAARVGSALARALEALPAEDRLMLRMRFEEEQTVRAIAAHFGVEARQLYSRFERLLVTLRRALEADGVEKSAALPLFEGWGADLELALG
jgi:RNA polymerase sigma factor (sigma-70 family)